MKRQEYKLFCRWCNCTCRYLIKLCPNIPKISKFYHVCRLWGLHLKVNPFFMYQKWIIESYGSESIKSSTKLLRWTTFTICFSDLPLILVSLPLALFLSLLLHTPDMVKASWKIIDRHTYGIFPKLRTFCRTEVNMLNRMLMLHYSACSFLTNTILYMWCICYFFKIILRRITAF